MAYFKPYIDEAGFHMPSYNDIKTHLIEEARGIYGQDIYLENDSQDYEFICLMADKIHDCYLTDQLVYNNRGPTTAIGGGLDGVVKLNGMRRKRKTKSKANVEIKGEPRTVILNGIIGDKDNFNWDLPPSVTIGVLGTVEVIAECQKFDHNCFAGEMNRIVTPTNGWESVNNFEPSTSGQKFEDDPILRARQSISTAKPSKTVLEGTIGGVAEIDEVTRYRVYENDTNVVDENTLPGHSIAIVAEGGNDEAIAKEIYLRKTPGCYTYGDVVVDIVSSDVYGMPDKNPIRFFRPRYRDIYVTINAKTLPGYVSQITDDIVKSISNYLNSLRIGDDLTISALWAVSLSAMPTLTAPIFSITNVTAGFLADEQSDADIDILFNEVTRGNEENIRVILS